MRPPRVLLSLALLVGCFIQPAAAQQPAAQTPNQEPLPSEPVPAGTDEPTLLPLPDEITLMPLPTSEAEQPAAAGDEKFKLQLSPFDVQPVLPPLAETGGGSLATALRVQVKEFRFEGNRVFSDRVLRKVVERFSGRELTTAELDQAREAVTLHYVNAGYINSGAVLEDQDLKDGLVVLKIIEGRLTRIDLTGNFWFRPWYLRHELRRAAGRPLNFNELKVGLQLLRQNPSIAQINAELMPGDRPGESILEAKVKEHHPFRLGMTFSNRRPPSVGAEIIEVQAADVNLTGHNDPLALQWGVAHTSSDSFDRWEYSEFENIGGSYEFPISPWGTTLEIHGSKSDSVIIEEPFDALEIESESVQYGLTLRQPIIENLSNLLAASLTADRRSSETFLLGRPFTLSEGAVDGVTEVFVLRAALEFVNRSQVHVLALRSTFNIGLNEFDATRHGGGDAGAGEFRQKVPDGVFFSWLGQGQYVRRLFGTDNLGVLRMNAQLANDPLLSLEQFSLGGAASVRGYRENQLLRDNGFFASLEVRVPVWRNKAKEPILALAPFIDFGIGWDRLEFLGNDPPKELQDDRTETLASIGLGVLFTPSKHVSAQLYWGYALNQKNRVDTGDNLQDYGLHFTISVNAF